jgi:hypothetical protein
MTDAEIQDFVTRFAAAWAARDGKAFLWHPEGSRYTPLVDRRIAGNELDRLMEVKTAAAPDFVWQLLDWTSRGDVVVIEWQTTRNVNGARFDWRGVDKFRIRDGKIIEERVYSDTAPLRAFRKARRWSRSPNSENQRQMPRHPKARVQRASSGSQQRREPRIGHVIRDSRGEAAGQTASC